MSTFEATTTGAVSWLRRKGLFQSFPLTPILSRAKNRGGGLSSCCVAMRLVVDERGLRR